MVIGGKKLDENQEKEVHKILQESIREDDRIVAELKASGKWIGGLDTHREAFEENKKRTMKAIREIVANG